MTFFSEELSFYDEGRETAERIARELHTEVADLGVELADIDIRDLCGDCGRDEYRISLGTVTLGEVEELTTAIRELRRQAQLREPNENPIPGTPEEKPTALDRN
jgi:hypothetical protein